MQHFNNYNRSFTENDDSKYKQAELRVDNYIAVLNSFGAGCYIGFTVINQYKCLRLVLSVTFFQVK